MAPTLRCNCASSPAARADYGSRRRRAGTPGDRRADRTRCSRRCRLARGASAPRGLLSRRGGGADDHAARPEARAARLRSARLARAVGRGRRLLHGRRLGGGPGGTAGEGPGGLGPGAARAPRGRRRAGRRSSRAQPTRESATKAGSTPRPGTSSAPKDPAAARWSPAADSHPARYRGPSSTRTVPVMRSPPASPTAWPAECPSRRR